MNKLNKLSILFPAALILLVILFSAFSTTEKNPMNLQSAGKNHKNTSAELVNSKKSAFSFEKVTLFNRSSKDNSAEISRHFTKASSLELDASSLREINSQKPSTITLNVPDASGGTMEVELVRINMLKDDFKIRVIGKNGISNQDFKGGIYYQGIIKGNNNSIASLSVFDNRVIGIFSTENGNYVLGSVKDANKNLTNDYILYNDADVINKPAFDCGSGDSYDRFYKDPVNNTIPHGNKTDATTATVGIYFVCDYQMFIDNGNSIQNTAAFVTGAFVHMRTLYLNEGLPIEISDIGVYDTPDPYINMFESITILETFGDNTVNGFPGDLAHLLSTGHGQQLGGIAWINVLCASYEPTSHSGRYAFSNIENDYMPFPQYSWTVEVMTHETGHNFGSMHTHACVWPTFTGQIDSCVSTAESCTNLQVANPNGTIMSYCHIPQGGAINFLRGFGPLPHDTITLRYNQALCLDSALYSSEVPIAFNLLQNYPNPFNPSTTIKFALPEGGLVTLRLYDVTGREVTALINNRAYSPGIFSHTIDASYYNMASGVYFYRLDVNKDNKSVYSEIKKMVLIK